jgi:hypothetical protein
MHDAIIVVGAGHNGLAAAGNADQRERIACLTAAGEAAIEAALPHWRKAQERFAALVQPPSAIAELADQLGAVDACE